MKVEAAIQQLNLLCLRRIIRNVDFADDLKIVNSTTSMRDKILQENIEIKDKIKLLESVSVDLKENYDILSIKEKNLEKKFNADFSTIAKKAFALLYKFYKFRPRTVLETKSSNELLDLAQCIISKKSFSYLTRQCLGYFNNLQALDVRPKSLPLTIEDSQWTLLVADRAFKVTNIFFCIF